MANKPMNPYAAEDFSNAIRKASEDLKKMGEQIKAEIPFMDDSYVAFNDMHEEYCGIMRLNYLGGVGAWQDVLFTLMAHGYEVTARVEDATETEKLLDGVEKWVVIEYEEVE